MSTLTKNILIFGSVAVVSALIGGVYAYGMKDRERRWARSEFKNLAKEATEKGTKIPDDKFEPLRKKGYYKSWADNATRLNDGMGNEVAYYASKELL